MTETPRSPQFDDIYFSVEDGLAESRYVFLEKNNLPDSWQGRDRFVIAETGFGTGLNFLCTWTKFEETTSPSQHLYYYSFEKFPISAQNIRSYLEHWSSEFRGRLERLVDLYPLCIGGWHTVRVSSKVTLILIFDDVNRAIPEISCPIDCWLLDGHAPAKNPDMWSEIVFHHIGRLSKKGTRLATFTAAGFVRRGLESAGFSIHKDRGFGRKRDMITGVFRHDSNRHIFSLQSTPQKIAIIGGGLAGACLAYVLQNYRKDITVFERSGLASGGSGNIRGLYNPRITAHRGPEADLYSVGFSLAYKLFQTISQESDISFIPSGTLHIINDETKEKRYLSFCKTWGWHENHARIINSGEASGVASVDLSYPALYLPDAGSVSPVQLVNHLTKDVGRVLKNIGVIIPETDGWVVEGEKFDAVILANGYDVLKFEQTAFLPLQQIRGQVTHIKTDLVYQNLDINLCYGGYASLAQNGEAVIGSTFQNWISDLALRTDDDNENIAKLHAIAPSITREIKVTGGRAGFRCAAKDRAPVIGRVSGFHNLYLSTAHGSHGILSSLIGAYYLAGKICRQPSILPSSVETYLSPNRFHK